MTDPTDDGIDLSRFKVWAVEELEALFAPPDPPVLSRPNGGDAQETRGASGAGDTDESDLPNDLLAWIRDGVSRDRSRMFMAVVAALKKLGFTLDGVYRLMARYPDGIASKYTKPVNRLRREAERAYNKIKVEAPKASASTAACTSSAPVAPAVLSSALPQPLIDARATFRKWLGAAYDMSIFDAVASAAAAERIGGDPLWLMVISGAGNAKTETVRSLEGAGAIVTSTISSEGALLSATPRSRGATGGLLHKIGSRGLLVFKDFTTILAMDGKVRGHVLAALREVHDGRWERNVGYAGARTLSWKGRIVVVAACTTAWDEAHKAIESMGDRFVLVRADSTVGRLESAWQAIENTGREDEMRVELAAALGALVASADMNVRLLARPEKGKLTKLANVVTWARSGVERDYRGVVVNAHALEMPTRFSKQLGQLMRGALSLGIPTEDAMRLATRCARDSLEPLRRDLLLDIAAYPGADPDDVHKRIIRPLTTVKNNLVALHALRLLVCEEREEWRGNRTFVVPHYSLASELDRAVLLSM